MKPDTSGWICSSVQKMCPSSWVKPRTRMMPCSAPDGSLRWQEPNSPAQRQVAVAVQALVEDLHVARAVHRLDRVVAILRLVVNMFSW